MSSPAPTNSAPAPATPKKLKPIKVLMGFAALAVAQLIIVAMAVVKGLTGNPAFSNPPVDMVQFTATVTSLQEATVEAQDGGKKATAARNNYRKLVIQGLKQLAVYVQANCNDDPMLFETTGFTAKSSVSTANQPVAVPSFKWIDRGSNSGQADLKIQKVTGAKSYNLRYAVMNGTTPGAWTTIQIAVVNKPITIANLTPGTTYGFQVQALGTLGLSDFSTTETFMVA